MAINTTAGTASELTRFAIISDHARLTKMAIVDWRCTPHIAVNDPMLMVGMPRGQPQCSLFSKAMLDLFDAVRFPSNKQNQILVLPGRFSALARCVDRSGPFRGAMHTREGQHCVS